MNYHRHRKQILSRIILVRLKGKEDELEIERLKKDLLKIRTDSYGTLEFLSGVLLESRALVAGRRESKKRMDKRLKTAEKAVARLTAVIRSIHATPI